MDKLTIPSGHQDSVFVVNASGGKDSTATILALREAEIPARYVFADTGWETDETYEYLRLLETKLGIKIDRVEKRGGMIAAAAAAARFPSRVARWCTEELKITPLRAYFDALEAADAEVVSVVGVRAEESPERARLSVFEYDDQWGGYVWRPLLHWLVSDVLAIHHRHGVPVNPLYRLGFSRVGCMPCIHSGKEDIRLMAQHFPERVDLIRHLERNAKTVRRERNWQDPGRHGSEVATFFQATVPVPGETTESGAPKRKGVPLPIDEAVSWSRTERGGKQLPLLQEAPTGGCFRWGLCDAVREDS